ncbi:MAG: efflux RND transporter periplasmic adaptor subunit, partial [Candidatus Ornithomonoglobus sp.]
MEEDVVAEETSTFGTETGTANADNAVPDSEKENVFGGSAPESENTADDDDDGGRRKKFSKKHLIIGACIAALVVAGGVFVVSKLVNKSKSETEYETVTVERKDIVRTVEGSSTLEANDTYNVTALVTGEILTDTFSEGDTVTKDQVLYTIDSSEAQRKVDSAQNSLTTAQQNFADAVKKKSLQLQSNANTESTTKSSVDKALESVETAKRNLATAQSDVDNLTLTANYTGTISEVLVKEGDSVNDGTKIAAIYDASRLKVQMPFNTADAAGITAGSAAVVTIASSNDTVNGTVESVSSASTATDSHAVVKYVTIVISNPGGLKAGESASATVNGVACSDLGTLENYEDGYITAKVNGRISDLWLQANDHITEGQVIGHLTSDSVTNALASAQSSVKTSQIDLNDAYTKLEQLVIDNDTYSLDSSIQSAEIALDNARISLEDAQDTLEDYKITAPIDGTIIIKNNKAGDKLEQNSNSSS